jgi:ABC-type phosphate transport system substrate-binding protein
MNKFVTIAAVAALATLTACSNDAAEVPADTATEAATEAAAELNADGSVIADGVVAEDADAVAEATEAAK